jgi:hypothetical protein
VVDRFVDRGMRRLQERGIQPFRLSIFFLEIAAHDPLR